MSGLTICDHCQEVFRSQDTEYGSVTGIWTEEVNVDLCKNCRNELDEWLHPEETKILKDWIKQDKKKKRHK